MHDPDANPFLLPLWLMLAVAVIVSVTVLAVNGLVPSSLIGLLAWIPWLITVVFGIAWEKTHPLS